MLIFLCNTKNKIGHLKINNYKFESVENLKYLGVALNEDNNQNKLARI
jgi:hypothetical protein